MSYKNTSLWKKTLGAKDIAAQPLRESFLAARDNATYLLAKIRGEFPFLTKHDISHVDSLWRVANTIIGSNYPINPLEGYLLGIAFLIHDVVLSSAAFGGKDLLQNTIEWKDAFAEGRPNDMTEEDFLKDCDFKAIRLLHGKEAETILYKSFVKEDGQKFRILNDDKDEFSRTILKHFGKTIGLIAASHHWDIGDIKCKLRSQVNPIEEISTEWGVNEQKLACILRCADAGHIDNGRAPDRLFQSLVINGVSLHHWQAQNHLCIVCKDKMAPKKLLITSCDPFPKDEFAAWNVAYEAIKQFDKELRDSNALLKSIREKEFPFVGVSGASSKEELRQYVRTTEDWEPHDIYVHTSDVKALIESLGGKNLYGSRNAFWIVMRELIQNARDAIHARCNLGGRFSIKKGEITIRSLCEDGKQVFEVIDNGIGMSDDCIKDYLLNFGSSYWKSSLSKRENPGLRSSGFSSIGEYGIGFYSVFMVANSVEVKTWRTTRMGRRGAKARKLEFPKGLTLSPIFSDCELDSEVSTIVRFDLKDGVLTSLNRNNETIEFEKAIRIVVAGLDADVFYEESGKSELIHCNLLSPGFDKMKWLSDLCASAHPKDIDIIAAQMEFVKDNEGHIRGLIAPSNTADASNHLPVLFTTGGLLSFSEPSDGVPFVGYLDARSVSASRNKVIVSGDSQLISALQKWAKKEYRKNYTKIIESDYLSASFYSFFEFCGLKEESLRDDILVENELGVYNNPLFRKNSFISTTFSGFDALEMFLFSGLNRISRMHFSSSSFTPSFLQKYDGIYLESMEREEGYPQSYRVYFKTYLSCVNESIDDYRGVLKRFMHLRAFLYFRYSGMFFHSSVVLCVWLNLMLDFYFGKMIDWRSVSPMKISLDLIEKSKLEELYDTLRNLPDYNPYDPYDNIDAYSFMLKIYDSILEKDESTIKARLQPFLLDTENYLNVLNKYLKKA